MKIAHCFILHPTPPRITFPKAVLDKRAVYVEGLMGQLIIAHTTLHIVTTPLAIAVFLGLAIYVITCNPHRPISWVFGLLCLTIASIDLSSLFMASKLGSYFSINNFLIKWEWLAIVLSSTLYLHLVFFYFPPSWQRYRLWILLPAYLFNAGLALTALFTDLFIVGPIYHPALRSTRPMLELFMGFFTGFFVLEMIAGAVGLFVSYRSTCSPSFRQHIVYLLITTALALVGSIIHWLTILTATANQALHLLPDMLLILAALLYARAVVRYGSFVGRPLARRSLLYSTLATIAGLMALYLTLSLDQWLIIYASFPYYIITGVLVLTLATSFPTLSQWLTKRLDQWFFQAECQQQALAHHLAEALAEAPNPAQLQAELLDTLRLALGASNGYVALSSPALPADKLAIQIVQGSLPLQPGDLIRRPPLHGQEPQLLAALLPQPLLEPGWQDIALFCPITLDREMEGILALSEKRDLTPFSLQELLLCAELTKQLNTVGRMMRLRTRRNHYLEVAHLQEQTLRQLEKEIVVLPRPTLTPGESQAAPLEIRILGPLQVTRQGQLVAEAAWGSEKAKGLLAYLLWKSPLGATREELCEALWPNRSTDETANVFHVTLHRLRRVLHLEGYVEGSWSYIQHERGRYRFNTDAPHWLDAIAFQTLSARNDMAALQAAVDLYRGAYLEDMLWAVPAETEAKRQSFAQLYVDALRRLAACTGERQAMLYLERILAIEPADETAHRALTLGYLARGRGDLARRQIGCWRQALAEFDLEPSIEARTLWSRIETKVNSPEVSSKR
jgi:DNA-binding SARP family transcriptional activator